MKKENSLISKISEISKNNAPVTSPIQQENLVSKVNSLTFHTCANSLSKPQNKSFNNEKGYTLNPKTIIDELVKISNVTSVSELFSKIYSIICQNIDSDFMAYPTGTYNLHIAELVKEAGYKGAFTIKYDNVSRDSNVYALERVPVFHTSETNKDFLERLQYIPLLYKYGWVKN